MSRHFFNPDDPLFPPDFANAGQGLPPSRAVPDPTEPEGEGQGGLLAILMQVLQQAGKAAGFSPPVPEGEVPSDQDVADANKTPIDSPQGFLENLINSRRSGASRRVGGFETREAAKEASSVQASRTSRDVRRSSSTEIEQEANKIKSAENEQDFEIALKEYDLGTKKLEEAVRAETDLQRRADLTRELDERIAARKAAIAEREATVNERKVGVQEGALPSEILKRTTEAGKIQAETTEIPLESGRQDEQLEINKKAQQLEVQAQNAAEIGLEVEAINGYIAAVQALIDAGMDKAQAVASMIEKLELRTGVASARSKSIYQQIIEAVKRQFGIAAETKPNPESQLGPNKTSDSGNGGNFEDPDEMVLVMLNGVEGKMPRKNIEASGATIVE